MLEVVVGVQTKIPHSILEMVVVELGGMVVYLWVPVITHLQLIEGQEAVEQVRMEASCPGMVQVVSLLLELPLLITLAPTRDHPL